MPHGMPNDIPHDVLIFQMIFQMTFPMTRPMIFRMIRPVSNDIPSRKVEVAPPTSAKKMAVPPVIFQGSVSGTFISFNKVEVAPHLC